MNILSLNNGRKLIFLLFVILFLGLLQLSAQTIYNSTIHLKVYGPNGLPLSNWKVRVISPNFCLGGGYTTMTTNQNGEADYNVASANCAGTWMVYPNYFSRASSPASTVYSSYNWYSASDPGQTFIFNIGPGNPNISYNINNTAISATSAMDAYKCAALTLSNPQAGSGIWKDYKLQFYNSTASGTLGTALGSAPWITDNPTAINLWTANGSALATSTPGYYLVGFQQRDVANNLSTERRALVRVLANPDTKFVIATNSNPTNYTYTSESSINNTAATAVMTCGINLMLKYNGSPLSNYNLKVENITNGAVYYQGGGAGLSLNATINLASLITSAGNFASYYSAVSAGHTMKVTFTGTAVTCNLTVSNFLYIKPSTTCRLANPQTGNVEEEISQTIVFPNPAQDRLTFQSHLDEAATVSLNLYDLNGRKVMTILDKESKEAGNVQADFDVQTLPAGMYLWEYHTATVRETGKLIKE